jgi:hypothetical protein
MTGGGHGGWGSGSVSGYKKRSINADGRRLRQDFKFNANLGYIASSRVVARPHLRINK